MVSFKELSDAKVFSKAVASVVVIGGTGYLIHMGSSIQPEILSIVSMVIGGGASLLFKD